uniref:Secreted protein n=1 Tax=Opuntia streptacantha TaxID=393608 RepID=A0A7C9DY60_OPUST
MGMISCRLFLTLSFLRVNLPYLILSATSPPLPSHPFPFPHLLLSFLTSLPIYENKTFLPRRPSRRRRKRGRRERQGTPPVSSRWRESRENPRKTNSSNSTVSTKPT